VVTEVLAGVRRQVLPDVAAGEYSWSLADSARLLKAGVVDCLQLDVTRCGGISEFLRGAAVPNLRHVEYFQDHQRIEQLLFDGALDPAGGVLTPDPGRPGLGLELRASDAKRYRQAWGRRSKMRRCTPSCGRTAGARRRIPDARRSRGQPRPAS